MSTLKCQSERFKRTVAKHEITFNLLRKLDVYRVIRSQTLLFKTKEKTLLECNLLQCVSRVKSTENKKVTKDSVKDI